MPDVRDNPDRHRYELYTDDGALAGVAVYHLRPGRAFLVHTEIDDAFEGQGLGGVLARGALDAVRASGRKVVPLCPFIAGWIERHDAYADLVDHELLASFEADR